MVFPRDGIQVWKLPRKLPGLLVRSLLAGVHLLLASGTRCMALLSLNGGLRKLTKGATEVVGVDSETAMTWEGGVRRVGGTRGTRRGSPWKVCVHGSDIRVTARVVAVVRHKGLGL